MKASRPQSNWLYITAALTLLLAGTVVLGFPDLTRAADPLAITSDDFNRCELNQELWTLVDPVGDAGLTLNGTQALLSVPAGVNHDVWKAGNRAPRIMQAAPDTDFEIEVKFDSGVAEQYQMQGILVEADESNFLRFDVYSNQGTRIFAAKFVDGSPTSFVNQWIAGINTAPLYMRVKRVGNQWTQSYSLDGQSWTVVANGYIHALNVAKVGVFAGNAGGNPAHTAVIDYFFNTAAPITPEDGRRNLLNVTVSGEGTVTPAADPGGYPCGEVVTLTAAPEPGWTFDGWSGDLTGSDNPATLKMDGDKSVTATFVSETATDTTPPVTSISTVPAAPQPSGWYTGLTTVNLTSDEPGATYYQFDSIDPAGYTAGDTTTAPEGNHTIYAFSVDLAGNTESPPVSLNLKLDSSVPSAPGSLEATGTTTTTVDLNWTPSSDNESGVDYYVIFNASDDSTVGTAPASSYTVGGLIPDTVYDFYVKAKNGAGTLSEASNIASAATVASDTTPPVIDVWYGENQRFGYIGNSQRWVNILGNVSDPDGVGSLTYTLNGGLAKTLSIGPNRRRLESPGDFNIDIDRADLVEGPNQVAITAVDGLGNRTDKTVVVDFAGQNVWPLPYDIDWGSTANIQDAVQVVDGKWAAGAGGLRTLATGYDRLAAVGDVAWTDYEVTVPITIHNVDYEGAENGLGKPPGLGIMMRWQGHTDVPISSQQPKAGWVPNGNIGWWRFYSPLDVRLEWYNPKVSQPFAPALETEYLLKARVESIPGSGSLYSLKAWQADQAEPADWNLTIQENPEDLAAGSLLLVANYVDATFGDVTVAPITVPAAYGLSVDTTGSGTVAVDPDQTIFSEGQTVTVTAQPETGWVFEGWSGDLTGTVNPGTLTMDNDKSITASFAPHTTTETPPPAIVSDDFNRCELNQELWTLVDPVGDAGLTLNGTQALLSVPAGVNHDVWKAGNRAPRIMQAAPDTDFEIEVKFDSGVAEQYQMQGILVEADESNFLRFDVYSNQGTRIFAAKFVDGSPTSFVNQRIAGINTAPLFMRVKRTGNLWTQSYSLDGQSWTVVANGYSHALAVTKVGVFAGNAGGNPAHTAVIDYFFNTAAPITPEDGRRNLLNVTVSGEGTVTPAADPGGYPCGEVVTLTAAPEPGWTFDGWSGDLTGTDNPATLKMDGDKSVTATFVPETSDTTDTTNTTNTIDTTPSVIGDERRFRNPRRP